MTSTTPTPIRVCAAPGCGRSLEGRNPSARTCSGACRVALHEAKRGRRPRGGAPREPWWWLTFTPGPDDPPFMRCEELHAGELASWLERRPGFSPASLNGERRTFERWRSGQVHRTGVYTADEILTALGLHLDQLPDDLWIEDAS